MKTLCKILALALLLVGTADAQQLFFRPKKPDQTAPSYSASSTRFTTDDYISRGAGLTGAADGKAGTCSFWIKSYTSGSVERIFSRNGLEVLFYKEAAGTVRFSIYDNFTPTLSVDMESTASVEGGAWHHVLAYWDVSTGDNTLSKVVVDGTEGTAYNITCLNANLDWTASEWTLSSSAGSMNCDISEFYLNISARVTDVTKFRSAGGAPVSLGADGSTPSGAQPIVYYKDPFTSLVNLGSGGDFTVTAGTLTAGSAIP